MFKSLRAVEKSNLNHSGRSHVGETLQLEGGRSYVAEFEDLAKAVRGEKKLAWSYQHDLDVHETLLQICGMLD